MPHRFALFAALLAAGPLPAKDLLVSAERMLDVRSGKLVAPAAALIRDGRIVEAGKTVRAPADAERIDLGDMTLLPGLIDMHVHLDSDPTYSGYTGLQFSDR